MATWKLYWVRCYSCHEEDWFIIAKSKAQAERFHANVEGLDLSYRDIEAEYVLPIPKTIEEEYLKKSIPHSDENDDWHYPWPNWISPSHFKPLGIEEFSYESKTTFKVNGSIYQVGNLMEKLFPTKSRLIKSTREYLAFVQKLPKGKWFFRGQKDAHWEGACSISRETYQNLYTKGERTNFERNILNEFKKHRA